MSNHTRPNLDHFIAQIKEFREDDKVPWKHAEKEMQRQARILQETGGSDEKFKEGLKKAGINVDALEKEAKRELEKQKKAFEELRKIEPPPKRRGQIARILLDQNIVWPLHDINTLIYL